MSEDQRSPGEQDYAAVCDELNDGSPTDCTLDDLDPTAVESAMDWARTHDHEWPPSVGSYDRYWERKTNQR